MRVNQPENPVEVKYPGSMCVDIETFHLRQLIEACPRKHRGSKEAVVCVRACCVENNAIEATWVGWSSLYELLERLFLRFIQYMQAE